MNTRIYLVTVNSQDIPSGKHLVEATSSAQAIRIVAEQWLTARTATTKEVVELMKNGTEVRNHETPQLTMLIEERV